jgi:23S rRNA (uracil1939-C5)-methyltransferase
VGNAEFHVADLAAVSGVPEWMQPAYHKALLDPPRSGAAEAVASLSALAVNRIVYVSCHPGSLARDAGLLVKEQGYTLASAGVMDMFPHTAHVESIALFERQ